MPSRTRRFALAAPLFCLAGCFGLPDCGDLFAAVDVCDPDADLKCFECPAGLDSVPAEQICDGVPNCTSGIDEECFACTDGSELPQAWRCDGMNDCLDCSDEAFDYCGPASANSECPTPTCEESGTCPVDVCSEDVQVAGASGALANGCACEQTGSCPPCPDGQELDAEGACVGAEGERGIMPTPPTDTLVDCSDGFDALGDGTLCDGTRHCVGNEDEDCVSCLSENELIPAGWLCDDVDDCKDTSDENELCSDSCDAAQSLCDDAASACGAWQPGCLMLCDDGEAGAGWCDGTVECPQEEDEEGCDA